MTNTTSVTPTTQQPNGATPIQANQSASGATSNEVTNNGSQTSATTQQAKKDDGIMAWCKRNWGWLLAGVVTIATGVYFLVRNHNKDKDKKKKNEQQEQIVDNSKEKKDKKKNNEQQEQIVDNSKEKTENKNEKFTSQENVDKLFTLANVPEFVNDSSYNDTNIMIKRKDGSFIQLYRDGTYRQVDPHASWGAHTSCYDVNKRTYKYDNGLNPATVRYMKNGNIQYTSSDTSIILDSTGSKILSGTKPEENGSTAFWKTDQHNASANAGNNGTLANSGQPYTDDNAMNFNNNDYSR